MERPACAEVERETIGDSPVILGEVFLDVIAGTNLVFLQIDLKCVDLAEQKAGDGVAAIGDALLIGARGGECKGACGVRRRDGVELVPADSRGQP